jgi:beta-lactam-binding protein with PASTA domain
MQLNTRTRILGLILIVAVVVLTFLWINSSGTVRSVPDQTNDETEVAPS